MFRYHLHPESLSLPIQGRTLILPLILLNLIFNIIANASFKASASAPGWRTFLFWQVVGNLAGLITVLTLTGLLRFLPLHVAFPVTTGLAVIGVHLIAGRMLFHEQITPERWLGAILVALGIVFLSRR